VSENVDGRHRAPGRFNPLSEISTAVTRSAEPAVKTSAIIAASGGLVAAFALPAHAASSQTGAVHAAAEADKAEASKVTTKVTTITVKGTSAGITAPKLAAPAVAAAADFGTLGFKAVAKPLPKPAPKPKPVVVRDTTTTPTTSRSTVRAPISSTRPVHSGILGVAESLVGIYYVYGGTTPAGFDCSGFTQYVYRQVGITIPRTAEDQRRAATPVSNPQPGDLVFFGVPAYHVGIYAGNGMMYDSPRTGKAVSLRSIFSSNVSYGRFS